MIHHDTFVAPGAKVVGDVTLGEGSSIWFAAVVRGDIESIKIGRFTNIQDGCVLHVSLGMPLVIGDYVSIGHRAVVHGCRVGNDVLVGIGAVIMDKAVIGDGSIIGAGALIPPGTIVPPYSLVRGVPGRVTRQVTEEEVAEGRERALAYARLWRERYTQAPEGRL